MCQCNLQSSFMILKHKIWKKRFAWNKSEYQPADLSSWGHICVQRHRLNNETVVVERLGLCSVLALKELQTQIFKFFLSYLEWFWNFFISLRFSIAWKFTPQPCILSLDMLLLIYSSSHHLSVRLRSNSYVCLSSFSRHATSTTSKPLYSYFILYTKQTATLFCGVVEFLNCIIIVLKDDCTISNKQQQPKTK